MSALGLLDLLADNGEDCQLSTKPLYEDYPKPFIEKSDGPVTGRTT